MGVKSSRIDSCVFSRMVYTNKVPLHVLQGTRSFSIADYIRYLLSGVSCYGCIFLQHFFYTPTNVYRDPPCQKKAVSQNDDVRRDIVIEFMLT